MEDDSSDDERTPLESLGVLAVQEVAITDQLDHVELFTAGGLVTLLWHGPRDATDVVLMGGGAMGGMLGPADGLFHDLGTHFSELGIGSVRIGYRRPNDLERCVIDMVAAAELAGRVGGRRFVTVGHSFGGAVALNAGIALGRHAAGVVTLSTQSAGCERADLLVDVPLLLIHGTSDEILPPAASEVVRMMAGTGELVILPGATHLLREAAAELRDRLGAWIPACFSTEPRTRPGTVAG
jgi:pimeloyl-ACP methyl ester carboxylesterase